MQQNVDRKRLGALAEQEETSRLEQRDDRASRGAGFCLVFGHRSHGTAAGNDTLRWIDRSNRILERGPDRAEVLKVGRRAPASSVILESKTGRKCVLSKGRQTTYAVRPTGSETRSSCRPSAQTGGPRSRGELSRMTLVSPRIGSQLVLELGEGGLQEAQKRKRVLRHRTHADIRLA